MDFSSSRDLTINDSDKSDVPVSIAISVSVVDGITSFYVSNYDINITKYVVLADLSYF
jgi:hypothetical protein